VMVRLLHVALASLAPGLHLHEEVLRSFLEIKQQMRTAWAQSSGAQTTSTYWTKSVGVSVEYSCQYRRRKIGHGSGRSPHATIHQRPTVVAIQRHVSKQWQISKHSLLCADHTARLK
jgi:hypothetical protein